MADDPSLAWLIGPSPRPRARWARRLRALPRNRMLAILVLALVLAGGVFLLQRQNTAPDAARVAARRAAALAAAQQPPHIDAPFAPAALRPLAPSAAIAWNATAPTSTAPNPPAYAFVAPLARPLDYSHSLQCLTMAVYYEAGNEPDDGQRAVAQVVLNRVRHVAYPHTVCGVVFEGAARKTGCQFTFACDGAMARIPEAARWRRANLVATAALAGYVYAPAGLATHYHANYVVPYWAASLDKIGTFGSQIFYRWAGAWGRRAAFGAAYAGGEPAVPGLLPPGTDAVATTAADAAPTQIGIAERPVLIRGLPVAAEGKTGGKAVAAPAEPVAAVGVQERWVVPHTAPPPASAPAETRRDIIMSPPPKGD